MIIHHHLGLGDHFICNGIVNYISKDKKIYLICKQHNLPTVASLYQNNQNVSVIGINGDNELLESKIISQQLQQPILYVGFNNCKIHNWDRSFYEQLNIDFIERYRFFQVPHPLPEQLIVPNHKFIFVHNQSSDQKYNLQISTDLPQIIAHKEDTNNLLSYINLIQAADEIHCINSSLFHLVDSLTCVTKKIYYHDVRQHPYTFDISPKWTIINYDN